MAVPTPALLRLLDAQTPAALAVLDRELAYVFATARWRQAHDLGDQALVGRPLEAASAAFPPRWSEALRRALGGEVVCGERERLVHADGLADLIDWEIRPWSDEGGAQLGVLITHERSRRVDAAGQDAHRERMAALRHSALVIAGVDPSFAARMPELLRLLVEEARRLTGADYGALGVGIDPEQRFEPWVWSGVDDAIVAHIGSHPRPIGLLGQIARGGSLRLDHSDDAPGAVGVPAGHPHMGPLLGAPVRSRGQVLGTLYLARRPGGPPFDVEDQTLVELFASHAATAIDNIHLTSQIRAELEARRDTLAVVSHDLKAPLNAISLREQLLARSEDPGLRSHALSVRRSVREMQAMVEGLLDVASFDAGRLRLSIEPTDVRALIDDVVEMARPVADDRGVALTAEVSCDRAAPLDRSRMSRVLTNLVDNSIKFTRRGGEVTVRASNDEQRLHITVTDNGEGISPDRLPRVFERFFTAGDGRTGTGLGLFIAKALTEAHRGRISLESELGRGTRAELDLPV